MSWLPGAPSAERFRRYLSLSQLVVVVGEAQVEPPPVDVHGLPQDGAGHGGTLDVPPRPPLQQRSGERRDERPPCLSGSPAGGWGLTFPHGESHDGSPGLDAFHRAKSLGDFFSPSLSAETLRSPAGGKEGAPQWEHVNRPQKVIHIYSSELL